MDKYRGTKVGTTSKGRRRRPPPRIRGPRGITSIWAQPPFQQAVQAGESRIVAQAADVIPGAGLVGPYAALYFQVQQVERVRTGVIGPINLFDGQYFNVVLAFCATYRPHIRFPPNMPKYQVAELLYKAGKKVPTFVRGGARQTAARTFLERLLRGLKLPPFQVVPLVVPHAMKDNIAVVKNLCRRAVRRIRCQPARDHILGKLRVMVGKRDRWVDTINSKKAVGSFSSSMRQLPTFNLGQAGDRTQLACRCGSVASSTVAKGNSYMAPVSCGLVSLGVVIAPACTCSRVWSRMLAASRRAASTTRATATGVGSS